MKGQIVTRIGPPTQYQDKTKQPVIDILVSIIDHFRKTHNLETTQNILCESSGKGGFVIRTPWKLNQHSSTVIKKDDKIIIVLFLSQKGTHSVKKEMKHFLNHLSSGAEVILKSVDTCECEPSEIIGREYLHHKKFKKQRKKWRRLMEKLAYRLGFDESTDIKITKRGSDSEASSDSDESLDSEENSDSEESSSSLSSNLDSDVGAISSDSSESLDSSDSAWGKISAFSKTAVNAATTQMPNAWKEAQNKLSSLKQGVTEFADASSNAIQQTRNKISSLKEGASVLVQKSSDVLKETGNQISTLADKSSTAFKQARDMTTNAIEKVREVTVPNVDASKKEAAAMNDASSSATLSFQSSYYRDWQWVAVVLKVKPEVDVNDLSTLIDAGNGTFKSGFHSLNLNKSRTQGYFKIVDD